MQVEYIQHTPETLEKDAVIFPSDSASRPGRGVPSSMGQLVAAAGLLVLPTTALAASSDIGPKPIVSIVGDTDGAQSIIKKCVSLQFGETLATSQIFGFGNFEDEGWDGIVDDLRRWSQLVDGWSSDHSKAPTFAALRTADSFRAILRGRDIPVPDSYIDSDGEIGFRWRVGSKVSAITFLDDGAIEAYIDERDENSVRDFTTTSSKSFPLDDFLILTFGK